MLKSQKLQLKISETRSRLNALAGLDELKDEERAETEKLVEGYADLEKQFQAALIAEDEAAENRSEQSGEAAELRSLESNNRAKRIFGRGNPGS